MAMTEQDQYRPRIGRSRAIASSPAVGVLGRLLIFAVFATVLVRVVSLAFHLT